MVKNILYWVESVDNRKHCISCDTKFLNGSINLPTETGQLTTNKTNITKEIPSFTNSPTDTDELATNNIDKSKTFYHLPTYQ